MKFNRIICSIIFLFSVTSFFAQEPVKKEEKKIQEVLTLFADPPPSVPLPDGSIPVDTNGPKPLDAGEILKRALNFAKVETKAYTKTNGVTSGSKAEFIATFKFKPKELNPQADVEGVFTMHVSIDAKEGKYRYTISKINHVAKNSELSGGDVYSEVPKCGSMSLPTEYWKKMRSEALKDVSILTEELKEAMKLRSDKVVNGDEW